MHFAHGGRSTIFHTCICACDDTFSLYYLTKVMLNTVIHTTNVLRLKSAARTITMRCTHL